MGKKRTHRDTMADYNSFCPIYGPFFGFMGATAALSFACLGAADGTAKSGVGVSAMGVQHPGLVMKCIIPVVMAGVPGIYGLIVAVIISSKMTGDNYPAFNGY